MTYTAFRYVGPQDIRTRVLGHATGTIVRSADELRSWLRDVALAGDLTATFIVSVEGDLVLAPRESEHVAAARGEPVLAAGEITFAQNGEVVEVTNQSTGYCPEPSSWPAVAAAVDRIGVARPDRFTTEFEFRHCDTCGSINLVKDGWFVCAVCGSPLPEAWNLG